MKCQHASVASVSVLLTPLPVVLNGVLKEGPEGQVGLVPLKSVLACTIWAGVESPADSSHFVITKN